MLTNFTLNYPRFFVLAIVSFIISSFIGQGISYSKIYLSHLFLLPFLVALMLEYRYVLEVFKKRFNFLSIGFFVWLTFSLSWGHDKTSFKYLFIYWFGFLQYVSIFLLPKDWFKKTLYILAALALLDLSIGVIETLGFWRFPISDLSPHVALFGKKSSFYFSELIPNQIVYLSTVPTGLRWGANYFILTSFIYLFFFARFTKEKFYYLLSFIVFLLTVFASARFFFWAGIISLLFFSFWKRNLKDVLFFLISFFLVILFCRINGGVLSTKLDECLNFPQNLIHKFSNFDHKIAHPVDKTFNFKSIANQVPSETHRYVSMKNAWGIFKASPVWGGGLGASSFEIGSHRPISPHFYLLEVLADLGIIGSLLYLVFIFYPIFVSFKYKLINTPFSTVLILMIIAGSITTSSLVYFPIYYLVLGFIHSDILDSIESN